MLENRTGQNSLDLCLVQMPQARVQMPSISLGVIQAVLARDGLCSQTFYANFWFLEFAGPQAYLLLNSTRPQDCLVDWLFASAAFPDFHTDHRRYLQELFKNNPKLELFGLDKLSDLLLTLRQKIPEFVDQVANRLLSHGPRIIGCSSNFQQHVASLALLRRVKELAPSVVTMMGGANCDSLMGQTTHKNFPWVDFLISGEADGFISGLCRSILGHGDQIPVSDLPTGVFAPRHRRQGYPVVPGGDGFPRASTPSLDGLPPPNYDDYFEEWRTHPYRQLIRPSILLESSRGCWWGEKRRCTFCGLHSQGIHFRSKPGKKVSQEIRTQVSRYGSKRLFAVDNILAKDYFSTLLPELSDHAQDLQLFYEAKANLSPTQLKELARSGVRWIQVGIESLHSRILNLINKGSTSWQNVQVLKWARQYGISVGWNLLFGFPGEKDEWYQEMAQWLPWLQHLQPGRFNYMEYLRFSSYFDNPEAYGLKLKPSGLLDFAYPLPASEIANLAYTFEPEEGPENKGEPLDAPIPDRPGLEATSQAMLAWHQAWSQNEVTLCGREAQEALEIRDTRPYSPMESIRLEGLARDVLERCEEAPTRAQICTSLEREQGTHPEATQKVLSQLVDLKLVLPLDDRLLSLVLRDPVPPLPKMRDYPGGLFLLEMFPKDRQQ